MKSTRRSDPAPVVEQTSELVFRAQKGDGAAKNEIFRRNQGELRQFAHGKLPPYVRHVGDTDDLVQETYIRALGRIDAFVPDGPGAFQRYLRIVLKNLVRDKVRQARHRPAPESLVEVSDGRPSVADHQMARDTLRRYRKGLRRLGRVDRALVTGRIKHGWDFEQIASRFQKPTVNAARVAVGRAFERLAGEMGVPLSKQRHGSDAVTQRAKVLKGGAPRH